MRDLKSDIIHAIYQCSGVDNEKLVEVSNICDKFQSRLDAAEALKPSHNSAMLEIAAHGVIRAFDLNYGKDPFKLNIKRLREALQLQRKL